MPWLSTPANRGRQKSLAAETLAILDENGFGDKSIGVVGIENMPHPVHELLVQDLGWKFTVPRDIVAELRYAKTLDEVEMMRRAAQLSDLEPMVKMARSGMRGIEIVAEIERGIRRKGADVAKFSLGSATSPAKRRMQASR